MEESIALPTESPLSLRRFGLPLAFLLSLATAQQVEGQGSVTGVVRDEAGVPVAGAQVQVLERRLRTLTEADGTFAFQAIPLGTYTLRVAQIGYQFGEFELAVADSSTQELFITLSSIRLRLADIVVTPGRFGVMESSDGTSRQALTREEMETMPQLGEDVFRGMRRLPGVASDDISTRLNPRGGTDQELLVMIDGLELYEPYHLKDFDGALGLIDVNSIGGAELATGGFSVEHGDKLTGVLDMTSRLAPVSGTRTTVGLSFTNASLMNRGSFDAGNGQWLFAARRGYLDIVLGLTGGDDDLSPQYYDIFGKVQHLVHRNHRVSVNVLHGDDDLSIDESDGILETGWKSSYGWLTWDASLTERFSARTIAWLGRVTRERFGDHDIFSSGDSVHTTVDDDRVFSFAGVRQDLSIDVTNRVMFKLGGEIKRVASTYDYFRADRSRAVATGGGFTGRIETVMVDVDPVGHEASGYVATRVRPVDPLTAEVGVRFDRISHTDDSDLAPRVLMALQLTPHTTLRGSWGRYFQSHGIHELEVADGQVEYFSTDMAEQVAVGVEHEFPNDVTVRIEAYRRNIADQHPRYINAMWELRAFYEAEADRMLIDPTRGRARGLEVMIGHELGRRWAWSAHYALASAEDEIEGEWVPRRHDQRHTIGFDATYRPNNRWLLAGAWSFHTGWPTTETVFTTDTLLDGSVKFNRLYPDLHGIRIPSYHRLDFRITRNFQLGHGALQAYIDLFNVYGRTNIRSYNYWATLYEDGTMVVGRNNGQELLPFLPSIGFRYEF
jgi:hypothetical protein